MAKGNASRLIVFGLQSSPRWLSTATATATAAETATATTATKDKEKSLYWRLFDLKDKEGSVNETLDQWVKEGNSLKRYDAINLVNQLRKFKKYRSALQIYEWMEKGKNKLNNSDRAIRLDLLAKTEGIVSAEDYFNCLEETAKTNKTYGALLNCYCRENMLDKATELFRRVKELASRALNYNNLMVLYLRLGQPEKVPLLLREMEENNVSADVYTYNQVMKSYALVKDFEAVEKITDEMETKGVKPDWNTYGNLATLYVNAGLADEANVALQKLEKMENLCDRQAFHTLITLYSRISNRAGVDRAWDSLKLAHPDTSSGSYLFMLMALFKLGDVKGLEECFREWESSCSTYDVRVSNVLLESYLDRDMIEEANLLSEDVVKKGAGPNLKTLHLFMNFYVKKRQIDLALQYLEKGVARADPEKHNWFPGDESVSLFLKYFEEEKDVDGAEKFFKNMKKISSLNGTIYNSLLKTYIAAGKMEPQMQKRMEEDGIEVTSDTEMLLQRVS